MPNEQERINKFKSDILSYQSPEEDVKIWSKIINVDQMGIPYDNEEGEEP